MPILYRIFLIFSCFNRKAKQRENSWKNLIALIPTKKPLRILVHASSMGEFEQAKPVIEEIKKRMPDCEIIASFFSPSGLENINNYKLIDYAVYLPIDTKKNAKIFVESIQPDISIFVRYDLWLNVLQELSKYGSKNYLICASKPSNSFFINNFITRKYLKLCFDNFMTTFTVGTDHSDFISDLKSSTIVKTLTDTRADRIVNIVKQSLHSKILPQNLLDGTLTLVAGSTWQKDEEIISEAVNEINIERFILRIIYAPHEPTQENLDRIIKLHSKVVTLSSILSDLELRDLSQVKDSLDCAHIVVDSIGKLLRLYANGDISYVGCGFGDGVHSVSEPAGYGLPIICGPNIEKMPDAVDLHKSGAVKIVENSKDLKNYLINMISDVDNRHSVGKIAEEFIAANSGSSSIIAESILSSAIN